jgi:hypothetical protein
MSALVQLAVIDELRLCAGGTEPTMRELRLAIGCSAAELAGAVQSLRYQGKIAWDSLALSPSMLSEVREEQPGAGASAPPAAGEPFVSHFESGPDDEDDEDYPGGLNDIEGGSRAGTAVEPAADPDPQPVTGFVPAKLLHSAGVHAANTRAASRSVPAPAHESEVERLIREEASDLVARRGRARSTGTVRQPLELRKFGVPDMDLTEAISSMLSDDPKSIMRAVSRRHPAMWRRVIYLARELGKTPMLALYDALETGLDQLEAEHTQQEQAA